MNGHPYKTFIIISYFIFLLLGGECFSWAPFCTAACILTLTNSVLLVYSILYWSTGEIYKFSYTSSTLLAPLGAWVRYIKSKHLPRFYRDGYAVLNELPTGTLLANFTGKDYL